jgi:hypothetical protein
MKDGAPLFIFKDSKFRLIESLFSGPCDSPGIIISSLGFGLALMLLK